MSERIVAALFVEAAGVYSKVPDVDVWHEGRDARSYPGPHPVVAHPPCASWSIMGNCRPEVVARGDDGCFAAALDAVRAWGGVLEHPRFTRAWSAYGLPEPSRYGWTRTLFADNEWTTEVDQNRYGHEVHKPTWLLYVGSNPPPLLWGDGGGRRGRHNGVDHLPGRRPLRTPEAFRDALLAMARTATD